MTYLFLVKEGAGARWSLPSSWFTTDVATYFFSTKTSFLHSCFSKCKRSYFQILKTILRESFSNEIFVSITEILQLGLKAVNTRVTLSCPNIVICWITTKARLQYVIRYTYCLKSVLHLNKPLPWIFFTISVNQNSS